MAWFLGIGPLGDAGRAPSAAQLGSQTARFANRSRPPDRGSVGILKILGWHCWQICGASKSARQGHCLPPSREDLPDNGNRLLPQLPRYRSRTGYLLLPGRFLWRSARFLQGYPVIQEPPLFQECNQIRHLRQRDIFFESLGHKRGLVRTNQLDVAP